MRSGPLRRFFSFLHFMKPSHHIYIFCLNYAGNSYQTWVRLGGGKARGCQQQRRADGTCSITHVLLSPVHAVRRAESAAVTKSGSSTMPEKKNHLFVRQSLKLQGLIHTRESRGIDRFCDYLCVYCIILSCARRLQSNSKCKIHQTCQCDGYVWFIHMVMNKNSAGIHECIHSTSCLCLLPWLSAVCAAHGEVSEMIQRKQEVCSAQS